MQRYQYEPKLVAVIALGYNIKRNRTRHLHDVINIPHLRWQMHEDTKTHWKTASVLAKEKNRIFLKKW